MMSFHTIHIIPHTTDIQMALQHFPLDIGTINCTFVSLVAHVETDILNRWWNSALGYLVPIADASRTDRSPPRATRFLLLIISVYDILQMANTWIILWLRLNTKQWCQEQRAKEQALTYSTLRRQPNNPRTSKYPLFKIPVHAICGLWQVVRNSKFDENSLELWKCMTNKIFFVSIVACSTFLFGWNKKSYKIKFLFCTTNFSIEFIICLIRKFVQNLMVTFKVVWIHSLPKSTLFQNQDAKLRWNLSPMCLFMSFKNQLKVTRQFHGKTKIEKFLCEFRVNRHSSFSLSIRLSKCPLYCPSANFRSVIPMGNESMVQCLVIKLKTKSAYPFF